MGHWSLTPLPLNVNETHTLNLGPSPHNVNETNTLNLGKISTGFHVSIEILAQDSMFLQKY
jgi:hypothetical protein